ncbi:delta(14)-sterol reductase TM7SF2 [Misgurnus anguillicaudatus]|uniref:delta(14)-sterol reductase TM7SF2 n=1 Tax=Misgurnus anguillicaudatus TaxID=75329 RepID=UPI003CCFD6DA
MSTHESNHQSHMNGFQRDNGHEKIKEVNSPWNNSFLCVLCVVLGVSLITLLDCCRPSSEPWVLLGSSEKPVWDWTSVSLLLLYTLLQGALYYLPVGQVMEGKIGFHGKRLKYKLNGLHAFILSLVLLLTLWYFGFVRASGLTHRLFSLVSAGVAVSLLFSLMLYLYPLQTSSSTQVHYETAKPLLNFILGQIMDPRVGDIDVKQFVMVRIGFIGWALMDVIYLLTAIEMKDSLSLSMLLVIGFHLIYILDFLIDEGSILTTKEFTEEPIGFIMIMGEYIWIPFFSSLPVYFLLQKPNHIHYLSAVPICLLFATGFLIYYLSNEQKDGFRRNPNHPAYTNLETIKSPSGKSLLVSGWFGWVRHPNYLGDIMMMLAWCLPCGFSSALPYLPALQCFNLLRKRANEIEESCLKKHGSAWKEYCTRVPYKVIPYVY